MKNHKKSLASLIVGSALILNSCSGGGNYVQAPENDSPIESPQPSPGDLLPSAKPETIESSDGVIVKAGNNKQNLEVFIPGAVLVNNSNNSTEYVRALALEDKGTAQEIKLPVGNESFNISFTDPDDYDDALMIGFKSENKDIDFTGAYDSNKANLITGNFDVFNKYFQVNKDDNNNKATLDLNFGNSLYNEGESDTITLGAWDYLNEGVKYSLPIRKDDLADISLYTGEGTDILLNEGQAGGDIVSLDGGPGRCPYDFDNSNKTIYFPTTGELDANPYEEIHCIPFIITPGSDDLSDNDLTTINVYEGNSTSPNASLVNNEVLGSDILDDENSDFYILRIYSLANNLSRGETRNLKVEVKASLNGDPNKLSSKIYNFTLKGDGSNIKIRHCLTADLNATSCTPGPNGDPHNTVIADTYTYLGDFGNKAIYEDNNGNRILAGLGGPHPYYVIPSTGAKLFSYVDKSNSTVENGRNYRFKLWITAPTYDNYISKIYPITTDPLNFSEAYILGDTQDLDNNKIQIVNCADDLNTLIVNSYRVFGNNYIYYESNVTEGSFGWIAICKNTPTQ